MPAKKKKNIAEAGEVVRDDLAIVRSALSNERTMLAYVRTSLTVFLVGASLFKFFEITIIKIAGVVLIFLGSGVFLVGLGTFKKANSLIERESKQIRDVLENDDK